MVGLVLGVLLIILVIFAFLVFDPGFKWTTGLLGSLKNMVMEYSPFGISKSGLVPVNNEVQGKSADVSGSSSDTDPLSGESDSQLKLALRDLPDNSSLKDLNWRPGTSGRSYKSSQCYESSTKDGKMYTKSALILRGPGSTHQRTRAGQACWQVCPNLLPDTCDPRVPCESGENPYTGQQQEGCPIEFLVPSWEPE